VGDWEGIGENMGEGGSEDRVDRVDRVERASVSGGVSERVSE
jgi:hypothetical protein